GKSTVGTATYTVTADDYPGPIVNTVVVSAVGSPTIFLSNSATARVDISVAPAPACRAYLPLLGRQTRPDSKNVLAPYLPVLLKPTLKKTIATPVTAKGDL
ncbi:MAG: hypothetical protein ACOC8C_01140, partial [Chloroflexota bacterium]